MLLAGEPTPEARYGKPTLMFLEVSAWRVPCAASSSSDAKCLRVRDRFFDARGLPAAAPGEWRILADAIEGYNHREGQRTVLRVKRFEKATAQDATPVFVYVLDLTIETSAAQPGDR
jgi:hypothetical protein